MTVDEGDLAKEGEVKECSITRALGQNQPSKKSLPCGIKIKMTGFKEDLTRTHTTEEVSIPTIEDRLILTRMIEI